MKNLGKILQFLNKIEKLKTVKRKISISDNSRKESPAEHTWRVAIMAMILHRELKLEIDLLRTLEIILVHDIIECTAGDVWILDKNDKNKHNQQQKKELQAAEEIYAQLPGKIGVELKELWLEYENQTSQEAKFAKALDKIEVIIQRKDLGIDNWENKDIYPVVYNRANEAVDDFPKLRELWEMVQGELEKQKNNKF